MTTTAAANTIAGTETRILREGYGDGAWHGPDLKAAVADVTEATAFRRPAPGRHNIAEIAVHHAFYAHAVRAKLEESFGPLSILVRYADAAEPYVYVQTFPQGLRPVRLLVRAGRPS